MQSLLEPEILNHSGRQGSCQESLMCCGRNLGDWDAVLQYTTQKRVQLRHRWLGLLYRVLALGVAVYVIGIDIILQKSYLKENELDCTARLTVEMPPISTVQGQLASLPYCLQRGNGTATGKVLDCQASISADVAQPPAPLPQVLFVATRRNMLEYSAQCDWRLSPACPLPQPVAERSFFAMAEDATVTLAQEVVTVSGRLQEHRQLRGRLVRYCDGKVLRELPSKPGVSGSSSNFSVGELLRAASAYDCGGRDFLGLDDDSMNSPEQSLRYAGVLLVLTLQYSRKDAYAPIEFTLSVKAVGQTGWVIPTVAPNCGEQDAGGTHRCIVADRAGVLLTVSSSGTVSAFDFMTLLIRLTAGWALLGLAATATDLAAIWLMRCRVGHGGGWCPCCGRTNHDEVEGPDKRPVEHDKWNNVYYRYMFDPSQDLGDVLHRHKRDLRKEELERWSGMEHEAAMSQLYFDIDQQKSRLNLITLELDKLQATQRECTGNVAGFDWTAKPRAAGYDPSSNSPDSQQPQPVATGVPAAPPQGGAAGANGTSGAQRRAPVTPAPPPAPAGGAAPHAAPGGVGSGYGWSSSDTGGRRTRTDELRQTWDGFGQLAETTRDGQAAFDDDSLVDEDSRR
eukprot:TRINITY_DN32908_c0_g1_i1.p1 TRINITY_DN32908_c0_g1~~TRINITY_DN32908_c0_g1_i1.p1  ORF type:complete len:676 (+),score=239.11 TRINITY_DN32908_c0_g1_i1:162-2030(+)